MHEETPKHKLWLSNVDVFASRDHVPTVYLYKPNGDQDFFSIEILKNALSKVLVTFYPLAVARAECTIDGFNDFRPSMAVRQLLVPLVNEPERSCMLALFQVPPLLHISSWQNQCNFFFFYFYGRNYYVLLSSWFIWISWHCSSVVEFALVVPYTTRLPMGFPLSISSMRGLTLPVVWTLSLFLLFLIALYFVLDHHQPSHLITSSTPTMSSTLS